MAVEVHIGIPRVTTFRILIVVITVTVIIKEELQSSGIPGLDGYLLIVTIVTVVGKAQWQITLPPWASLKPSLRTQTGG